MVIEKGIIISVGLFILGVCVTLFWRLSAAKKSKAAINPNRAEKKFNTIIKIFLGFIPLEILVVLSAYLLPGILKIQDGSSVFNVALSYVFAASVVIFLSLLFWALSKLM